MYKEAKALDCIVCGEVLTDSRKGGAQQCNICGSNDGSMYHRHWSCHAMAKHTDEAICSTQ